MSFGGAGARKKYLAYVLCDSLDDGNLRNVEYLLVVKNADPNEYLEDLDLSPMHFAVGTGTEEFACKATLLCLKYGGNPNVRNQEGNTPVHIAACWGRRKVADILLNFGGDPFIKDVDGNTALDLALDYKQEHLYSRFVVHKFSASKPLHPVTVKKKKNPKRYNFESEDFSKDEELPGTSSLLEEKLSISDLEKSQFTDIDSDLNFVEIFVPSSNFINRSKTSLSDSTCSDVSNVHRSRSNIDVINSSTFTRSSSYQSLTSIKTESSAKSWATEYVRNELKRLNLFCGPVVKSTKRLYTRQLRNIIKNPEKAVNYVRTNEDGLNEVLANTFDSRLPELISKWSTLLDQMEKCFIDQPGRGSREKCYFTYILLDPFITLNLPQRMHKLSSWETWKIFINAIFYVGKGKNSRPMAHLHDAVKANSAQISDKIARIKKIWSLGSGIVCVQAFHNLNEVEAFSREAAMIDALYGSKLLTNRQAGDYSGKIKYWDMKNKRRLGVILLYRAMQIYLAENERQICQEDI